MWWWNTSSVQLFEFLISLWFNGAYLNNCVSSSQLEKPSLHAWLFIYQFLKNFNVKIVEYLLPISKLNKPIYNYCLLDVTQASFVGAYQLFVWLLRHGSVFKTLYTTHNYEDLAAKYKLLELLSILWLLIYSWFTTVFMNLAID